MALTDQQYFALIDTIENLTITNERLEQENAALISDRQKTEQIKNNFIVQLDEMTIERDLLKAENEKLKACMDGN